MTFPLGFEDVRYVPIDPGAQSAVLARFLGRQFGLVTVADSVQPVIVVGDATQKPEEGQQLIETYHAAGNINRLPAEGNVFEIRAPGDSVLGGVFRDVARGFLSFLDANLSNTVFQGLLARETQGFQSDVAVIIEDVVCWNFPQGSQWTYVARFVDDPPGAGGMVFADNNELQCVPTNTDVSLGIPGVARADVHIGSRTPGFIGTPTTQPNAPSMPFNQSASGFSVDPIGRAFAGGTNTVNGFRPFDDATPFLLPPATTLAIGSTVVGGGLPPPAMGNGGLYASVTWREVRVRA